MWLSKDGRIVIMHDPNTQRVGGRTNRIATQTWEELQRFDVGGWKGEQFKGERIPTLEAIIASIPPGKRAVLEIKCGPEIVPELERVIRVSKCSFLQLAIISFNFEALKASKEKLPQIQHYFLMDYKTNTVAAVPKLGPLIEKAKAAKFDGLDLQFRWPIDKAFVKRVHDAGMRLVVWTVDDTAVARRLVESGVDGITTNRPGWLREQLKEQR
jgi:glycerophosphoryl diester phosphodiesterase